jgi:hypothetical protein
VRRVPKALAGVLAVFLLTAGLAACGGSSDSSSSNSTEATQAGHEAAKEEVEAKARKLKKKHVGGNKSTQNSEEKSEGSDSVATPLKVSGGGSAQFRVKGGDNSIQDYGEESGESELQEAAEALHGFYVARAEEDWSRACSYLGETVLRQLQQLASQSQQLKDKSCAAILHAFTRPLPASVRRENTVVNAGSLRSKGEQSFLIYYGEGHTVYAIPMKQEGGDWKVTLLSATPLD